MLPLILSLIIPLWAAAATLVAAVCQGASIGDVQQAESGRPTQE